jgi:hypothetical protein
MPQDKKAAPDREAIREAGESHWRRCQKTEDLADLLESLA